MKWDCWTYRVHFPNDFGDNISELSTLTNSEWESRFYFIESDFDI